MRAGVKLVHLADLLRLRATKACGSFAWFLDADPVWVNKAPSADMAEMGHIFGSLRSRPLRGSKESAKRHWLCNYLKEPGPHHCHCHCHWHSIGVIQEPLDSFCSQPEFAQP